MSRRQKRHSPEQIIQKLHAGDGDLSDWIELHSAGDAGIINLIETNVEAAMKGVNALLLSRIAFETPNPGVLESLTLRTKYDAGFVAYLNGYELARRNAPGTVAWNSAATLERTDEQTVVWEWIDLSAQLGKLQPGTTLLGGWTGNLSNGGEATVNVTITVAEPLLADIVDVAPDPRSSAVDRALETLWR